MYIIRICKYYGFSRKELDLLFHSLILSILVFGIEVWACASYSKYLSQVDKLLKRAYKYGYLMYQVSIVDILNKKHGFMGENNYGSQPCPASFAAN